MATGDKLGVEVPVTIAQRLEMPDFDDTHDTLKHDTVHCTTPMVQPGMMWDTVLSEEDSVKMSQVEACISDTQCSPSTPLYLMFYMTQKQKAQEAAAKKGLKQVID